MRFLLFVLLTSQLSFSQQIAIVDVDNEYPGVITPWKSAAIETREFTPYDCSVIEGCIEAGTRKLLVFSVTIYNPSIIPGDIWSPTNAHYHYDECHRHYHMEDFSEFLLLKDDQTVVSSRKMGWCVRNWYLLVDLGWNRYPSVAGCVPPKFDPGWSDTYSGFIGSQPCMWWDITNVPDGDYTMWIEIDPLHKLNANYIATHPIRISGTNVSINNTPIAPIGLRPITVYGY